MVNKMIEYRKGDLFDNLQEKPDIIAHACNAKGMWGSGFAHQCANKYPRAYKKYQEFCNTKRVDKLGTSFLAWDDLRKQHIGCLITSKDYGKLRSSIPIILTSTATSVNQLLSQLPLNAVVFSPKINAGLFGVPWKITEEIIKPIIESNQKNIRWVVWEL